jgi:murein DD-endopeptidase MepM/ murein hydrolase activator NlpD
MKPGSVRVKAGDRVSQGQEIGNIGFSGDSIFPHLHYALMDGAEVFKAWGLPAYFKNFRRKMRTVVEVPLGPVNSGMFVESEFHYPEGKRD